VLPAPDRRFALADLEEELEQRVARDGARSARSWYRRQVLRSVLPGLRSRMAAFSRWLPGGDTRRKQRVEAGSAEDRHGIARQRGNAVVTFLGDLRVGFRSLRRAPLALTITVLSLGLGIGAVTAAYAVVNSLLFRAPVGLSQPDRLVTLYTSEDGGDAYGLSSFPDYEDVARELESLEGAAAIAIRSLDLGGTLEPRALLAEEVTANYFAVTGIRPVIGRAFAVGEGQPGAAQPVAVLGHDLWVQQFGADSGVVGGTVRLNGREHTVVGVAPDGVVSRRAPLEPDVWVPLGSVEGPESPRNAGLRDRGERRFLILARLRPGASLPNLRAQATVLEDRLAEEYPGDWTDSRGRGRVLTAMSERDSRLKPGTQALLGGIGVFFVGTTGLILLIACSNVTSLFLARANRRSREMGVRAALGAGRGRLIAMLLTEALIPGAAAGLVGLLVAAWIVGLVAGASLPMNLPVRLSIDLDGRVLGFAAATALGASLIFGLLPALHGSRPDILQALKGDGRVRRKGRMRARDALVVVQCAASLVLLVGATLFVRALGSATRTELGVDPERVAVATQTLALEEHGPEQGIQYYKDLRSRLAAVPGVEDVQLSRSLELTLLLVGARVEVTVDGTDPSPDREETYFRNTVTPGYMRMLGIPLLRGRSFQESDGLEAPLVAVVNQTLAERFWPGEDPLGRQFEVADPSAARHGLAHEPRTFQVVGVAADGKYGDFDEAPTPYFWTSLYQDYASTVAVSVKGVESAEAMIPVLREHVVSDIDQVQLLPPSTYASQLSIQFVHLRVASRLLTWGGAFGLFLAVIGIYGIVSVAVTQRTREMAVRMAIGAERGQVLRVIVREGMTLALLGLALGVLIALPAARAVRSVLAGVSPLDPLAFGAGLGVLLLAALLASVIPARRATRIDPMRTLRQE
jgi:predicted permease